MKETITVCSACLRACCWQGQFMCDDAKHAGTKEMTRAELEAMKPRRENPEYWDVCPDHGVAFATCKCGNPKAGDTGE